MFNIIKYSFATVPLLIIANNIYKSISKPFEIKIKGNNRMLISFKKSYIVKLISIKHICDNIELDSSYSQKIGDLIIEKHTVFNKFINDFPILSLQLTKEKSEKNYGNNYFEILDKIEQFGIKTHIFYSTPFSKKNEIILDWNKDAIPIYDNKF